mmetsp:Transcript_3900/g.6383  ORF Transcript_3900/g.6383 Transcript_3900/m.6383 type:complete len:90 (-) Transcript_3900:111-380(-)
MGRSSQRCFEPPCLIIMMSEAICQGIFASSKLHIGIAQPAAAGTEFVQALCFGNEFCICTHSPSAYLCKVLSLEFLEWTKSSEPVSNLS